MKIAGCEYDSFLKLHEKVKTDKSKRIYKIPYYQRPYEWDNEHIFKLIDDFDKNKKMSENGEDLEYFAGAVVFVNSEGTELEIVDGQQRITTMFLLNCLRFILMRERMNADIRTINTIPRVGQESIELIEVMEQVFCLDNQSSIKTDIKKLGEQALGLFEQQEEDKKAQCAEEILKGYQKIMHTASKSVEDTDFIEESQKNNLEFYQRYDLSLQYSMSAYNEKLKKALSKIVCSVDFITGGSYFKLDQKQVDKIKKEDEVIGQYVDAMFAIYKNCEEIVKETGETGRKFTQKMLDLMKEMVDNIKICAVFAENERDAYMLFESLNDRSKKVGDLELIKNLYLRSYYSKSLEDEKQRESGMDRIAREWDSVFAKCGRKKISLITLLGTVYLTGDTSIDGKNNDGARKSVDVYLNKKASYSLQEVLDDIKIYKMVRLILEKSTDGGKLNTNLLKKENDANSSIVCKTVCLLQVLQTPNVLSGLVNVILHFYLMDKKESIDIDDFENIYLKNLYRNNTGEPGNNEKVYTMAHNMWRLALLAKDHKLPRIYSVEMIKKYHKTMEYDSVCDIPSSDLAKAKEEFDSWITTWRYSRSNKYNIRLKVLFFRLIQTNKNTDEKKLEMSATRIIFENPEDAQLDHLEPENPEDKSGHGYFGMNDIRNREDIVNSIGNFMLLDDYNNIKKSNGRFENAMRYYDKMFNGISHWMIEDIKAAFSDSELVIEEEGHKIPTEKFFQQRREQLCKYFKAILSAERYDATEIGY